MRPLDGECEALLMEEQVNQDLRLDKLSREMVRFRQMMERHFCSDFTAYLNKAHPAAFALWEVRDPDVSRLLSMFRRYLGDLHPKEAPRPGD